MTVEFVNDMGLTRSMLLRLYGEVLARTRQAGAAVLWMTPHFTMPSWMGSPDGRGVDRRPAVSFLRHFAADRGLPLVDASRRWERLERIGIPYETLLKNGINHPDDRGHRIYAEELLRFFPR